MKRQEAFMETILLLLVGAVIGAVASAVVDRLFKRFIESVPKVRVSSSCSYGDDGQKFNLVVTNIGIMELPPYKVVLRHSKCGYISLFPKAEASERLPQQMERFSFSLGGNYTATEHQQQMQGLLSMLTVLPETRTQMSDEEFKQWHLQLILTHSDNFVLFDHAKAGAAVAEIVRAILSSGQVNPTGEQMRRVYASNSWIIKSKRGTRVAFRRITDWWKRLTVDPRVLTAFSAAQGWYACVFGRHSPK
jgi:hypothetical protein